MRSTACSTASTRAASTCFCTPDSSVVMAFLSAYTLPTARPSRRHATVMLGLARSPSRSFGQCHRLRGEAVVHVVALVDRLLGAAGANRRESVAQRLDQIGITLRPASPHLAARNHPQPPPHRSSF